MRLYGALSELTSLVIRLASGKTVKIQANEQTAAGETQITIPDVVDGADTVVLVDTQQTLTQKTLTSPTLTTPTMTNAAINSTTKVVIPSQNSPTHNQAGSLIWDGDNSLLTVGSDNLGGFKVMADLDSSQTLFSKTLSGSGFSGGTIGSALSPTSVNYINKLDLTSISGTGASHVVITNANKEVITEATLSKARGGAGADMTNVVFPATGTLVTEDGSQTLSNKTIGTVTAASGTMTISGTGALRLPLGTEANRPAGTAATLKGMIRYNDEADAFEGYNELSGWSSLGGGGTTDRVTQASHGFVVGEVLYLNGSTYAKALATAANTAEVVGVVSRVIDASTFELTLSGEISGLSGLTPGEVYFLDASTPGAITIVEPSVVGQVSLPVGVASSATTLYVAPKRGVVVGAANARTTISVSNNAATNVVSVTNYNSLKLEGELNVTRSSGGNQRAYYTVEAAKNGAGVWQVSASYTGDDVLYTTLPSWDVASNNLQVTMPLVTNFSSASLTYALNAPAVGASLPLSVDSSALNIVDSAPLSYRNLLINGDMRIWQRSTDANSVNAAGSTGSYVAADRWKFTGYSGAIYDQGRMVKTTITDLSGFNSGMKLATRFSSSQAVVAAQFIESQISYALAGNQCTLSFYIRKLTTSIDTHALRITVGTLSSVDTTGDIATEASYNNAFDSTRISMANVSTSWTRYTYTFTMPAAATNGVCVRVGVFKGTTDIGAYDCIELTGVQLEVGSKASAFERRPYGMELQLCQRYYEKSYNVDVAPGTNTSIGQVYHLGATDSNNNSGPYIQFKVSKRVKPTTFTVYTPAGASGSWAYARNGAAGTGAVDSTILGTHGGLVYINTGAPWVAASINGHWTADAEL